MTIRKRVAQASAAALLMIGGAAHAGTKVSADASVNGGVASNPYNSAGGGGVSGTLSGIFTPVVIITSPTGSLSLTGNIAHTEYSRLYGGTTDYSLTAGTGQQLSPMVGLSASAGYSSQIRSSLYPVFDPTRGPVLDPNAPIIVDPTATASFAERTETFNGNLGLSVTLSPRDSLNVNGYAARVTYPSAVTVNRNYDYYGAGFDYLRQVGANTSIGFGFSASRNNYRTGPFGDGRQYSPTLELHTKFDARTTLELSVGATFNETDLGIAKQRDTAFSGSVQLCRGAERSSFCLDASQRVSPSSVAGTSKVTALGASYSYTIDQRSQLGARISYSRAAALSGSSGQNTDYGLASLSYSRTMTHRLSLVVSASYSDSYDSFANAGANYAGSIGVRYRLGDL